MASALDMPDAPDGHDRLASVHRRVDLQSPLDLAYLLNNARAAARSKIDLHLPLQQLHGNGDSVQPAGGPGDEMRRVVEQSVDAYIDATFQMARQGVSVNGIEGERVDWGELGGAEEYEPYDGQLAKRITALHGNIEKLNLELATIRRESAAQAVQDFRKSYTLNVAQVDAALAEQEALEPDTAPSITVGFKDRGDEVAATYAKAAASLGQLGADGDGSLRLSLQRARDAARVVEYIEGR